MLKKVALCNVNTGRTSLVIVDTDTDDKAIMGAGKAANELAKVTNIVGADEKVPCSAFCGCGPLSREEHFNHQEF